MIFPAVNTSKEILDALEQHQGCFIIHSNLAEEGEQAYLDSNKVFDTEQLAPLDTKTMFPTKIATLPGVERQVIQQYARSYFIPESYATKNVDLQNTIREIISNSYQLVDEILLEAKDKYGWTESLYEDLADSFEWTLNIARYPFVENKANEILFPAHKDWGLLAVYPFIYGPGLEVYKDGAWNAVMVPYGTTFCYAGDIFTRVTNGKVPALLHRVIQPNNLAGSRTSVIFYADPIREMILPTGEKVGDIIDSKLKKIGQIK